MEEPKYPKLIKVSDLTNGNYCFRHKSFWECDTCPLIAEECDGDGSLTSIRSFVALLLEKIVEGTPDAPGQTQVQSIANKAINNAKVLIRDQVIVGAFGTDDKPWFKVEEL